MKDYVEIGMVAITGKMPSLHRAFYHENPVTRAEAAMGHDFVVGLDEDPIQRILIEVLDLAVGIADIGGWDIFGEKLPEKLHPDPEITARIFCIRHLLRIPNISVDPDAGIKEGTLKIDGRQITYGVGQGTAVRFSLPEQKFVELKKFVSSS